ncbi:MAG: hypothetical protein AAB362_03410 [Patescibacteria group bacterium]
METQTTGDQAGDNSVEKSLYLVKGRPLDELIPKIQKRVLYAIGLLLPLWFLPYGGIDLSREFLFGTAILVSFGLWLFLALFSGTLSYIKSPLNIAVGAFLAVNVISAIFSKIPYFAIFSSDATAEKLAVVIFYVLAYWCMIATLKQKKDSIVFPLLLIGGGTVMALVSFLQFFGIYILPFDFVKRFDFNVVGTLNALSLFYGFLLIVVLGFLLGMRKKTEVVSPFVRRGLWISAVLFLLNIVAINFIFAWIGLLAGTLALLFFFIQTNEDAGSFRGTAFYGLSIAVVVFIFFSFIGGSVFSQATNGGIIFNAEGRNSFFIFKIFTLFSLVSAFWFLVQIIRGSANFFRNTYFYSLFGLIAVSLLFVFVRVPLFSSLAMPIEISSSAQDTVAIARKVWDGGGVWGLFFGTGPGTFQYNYGLYHNPLTNLTNFWEVRFVQGYSYITTAFSTTGVAGVLSLMAIIAIFFWTVFRGGIQKKIEHPLFGGIFGGVVFLFFGLFFYPSNMTLNLALFFSLGFITVIIGRATGNEERSVAGEIGENSNGTLGRPSESEEALRSGGPNAWRWFGERNLQWKNPWALFGFSIAIVFFLALALGGIYGEVQRYRAALKVNDAVVNLRGGGSIETTIQLLSDAVSIDYLNDRYFRFLAQGRLLKVQGLINESFKQNPSATVQADFQKEVENTVIAFQRSIQLNPIESFNYRTAGALYDNLISLFISGADQAAFAHYAKAIEFDPLNPLISVELARSYITAADVRQAVLNRPGIARDRARELTSEREQALQRASEALGVSISLKRDFASAHFLLSQVALRQGKQGEAIKNLEEAAKSAPRDIGIIFQLGVMYYQNRQYGNAEEAFGYAVSLNSDYSNAKYFLGLLLDRRGEKEGAIKQFEEIAKLNLDNQEVKQILENLRAGRGALSNISPPEPQDRKDVPISEGGKEKTPIRKR